MGQVWHLWSDNHDLHLISLNLTSMWSRSSLGLQEELHRGKRLFVMRSLSALELANIKSVRWSPLIVFIKNVPKNRWQILGVLTLITLTSSIGLYSKIYCNSWSKEKMFASQITTMWLANELHLVFFVNGLLWLYSKAFLHYLTIQSTMNSSTLKFLCIQTMILDWQDA